APIVISNNTVIKARVFVTGTNLFPGAVAAREYLLLDASVRDFNSNLPLMIINTPGTIPEGVPPGQPRMPGALTVIDTYGGRTSLRLPAQFQGLAEFELYGQTSVGFPKKPYRLETQDELRNPVSDSLLGLPAAADWKL